MLSSVLVGRPCQPTPRKSGRDRRRSLGAAAGFAVSELVDADDKWTAVAVLGGRPRRRFVRRRRTSRARNAPIADGRGGYYGRRLVKRLCKRAGSGRGLPPGPVRIGHTALSGRRGLFRSPVRGPNEPLGPRPRFGQLSVHDRWLETAIETVRKSTRSWRRRNGFIRSFRLRPAPLRLLEPDEMQGAQWMTLRPFWRGRKWVGNITDYGQGATPRWGFFVHPAQRAGWPTCSGAAEMC